MNNIYTLPEITFVGGEKQKILLNLKTPKPNGLPFNANSCTVDFSIINSNNKIGIPILSKSGVIQMDDNFIPSIVLIELSPIDTIALYGKYIYQITIIDMNGNSEIPRQGFMFITKNINQNFIIGNVTD